MPADVLLKPLSNGVAAVIDKVAKPYEELEDEFEEREKEKEDENEPVEVAKPNDEGAEADVKPAVAKISDHKDVYRNSKFVLFRILFFCHF